MACVGGAHRLGDLVTLCEELLGIVLRHHRLHDFIADGRQHPLVPVRAQILGQGGVSVRAQAQLPLTGTRFDPSPDGIPIPNRTTGLASAHAERTLDGESRTCAELRPPKFSLTAEIQPDGEFAS